MPGILLNAYPSSPSNPRILPPDGPTTPSPSLDLKQIKQIIDLMKRSELSEFAVEEEGFKLKIRRGMNGVPVVTRGQEAPARELAPAPAAAPAAPATPAGAVEEEPGVAFIKSPMVGTFYRAASPESKSFIDIGARVEANTVVCIIEAMKIMNEIQAEAKGTVLEILVENGQPVEYGQRLFKIKQG
ncbi:MAG TPA: acetyl-CoA carboxylase biotin carboxyl carrier protein [Opitutaceae bacterium]|nr:acetyl-CoA carboxylase biotin carboxyl carrier protein [Opitutaceae bacterium]